jgi:quinol monooxygenase YgiN
MFVLQVNITIKPENVDAFMRQLDANAREARKEPGCKEFQVLVDPKDKAKIMLY